MTDQKAEEALQRIARAAAEALRRAQTGPTIELNVPMFVDDLNAIAHGLGMIERTANQWGVQPSNAIKPPVYPHPEPEESPEAEPDVVAMLATPLPVIDLTRLADVLQSMYGFDLVLLPFSGGEMARFAREKP